MLYLLQRKVDFMRRGPFTKEEQEILAANPYTLRVSEIQIYFTREFKEEFWKRYQAGDLPRKIITDLGYDPDMLGSSRISGIQSGIKNQAASKLGFREGYPDRKKHRLEDVEENPTNDTVIKMQHEILYLRQEVEFLKKISSIKNSKK